MLNDTKRDLTALARRLAKPYEQYSIDELADAYCDAVDSGNETLKDIYISALVLRFWFKIDKMYKADTVAPCLEHEDFFWWLYEAIEYACHYRGWRDADKKLNAQQCINKCIDTIKLQKYYNLRLDKNKTVNYTVSMDAPVGGDSDDKAMTIGDMLEAEETWDDHSRDDVIILVQNYINRDKIVEAILIDNIAFNDVQRYYKQTIKTETGKYTDVSSEFHPYRLVQIVSKLPEEYRDEFMRKYKISEKKLDTVLAYIGKSTNQRIYKLLDRCLAELRTTYAAI
jgi:hypothetical protein